MSSKFKGMKKELTISLLFIFSFIFSLQVLAQAGNQERGPIGLENKSSKEKELEEAPNFTLLDLEGNKVSLEEYKGKVVILDFWATWCAPCIKSFPAMQEAVNRYEEDSDVQFLFINTWEQQDDPTSMVQQFMDKRGFDFVVLMDKKESGSRNNPVVESYGVIGIPAKFIIDGDGKIRHRLTGFAGGDNEEQVKELSLLIEDIR